MENVQKINYSKLGILSVAHTLNDFYSNYLPQLLPFLVALIPGFTATQAAVLVSAFTITSSFTQPLIGYYLDGHGKRWFLYIGTFWMAVMLSLTGFVSNFGVLVLLSAAAGLGTALFHPQAASTVNQLSGNRKAVILSGFVAFGNIGFALAPLLLVPLFQSYGLRSTLITVIPGVIVTVLLLLFAPRNLLITSNPPKFSTVLKSLKASAKELTAIVGVIAIRALAYTAMLTILPLYFKSENYSNIFSSYLITIMLLSGAFGGIIGGFVSDRYGRKRLIVGSLVISSPLFFAFLYTQGILSMIFLALAGAALLSSFSVTVIAAQEAIPDNKALAAGLTMGLAGGLGALPVVLIGYLGDTLGLGAAVNVIFLLPVAAGAVGLFMQSRPAAYKQR